VRDWQGELEVLWAMGGGARLAWWLAEDGNVQCTSHACLAALVLAKSGPIAPKPGNLLW
jgi:hypothetical protein